VERLALCVQPLLRARAMEGNQKVQCLQDFAEEVFGKDLAALEVVDQARLVSEDAEDL
jgi:hypothetical protein